MKTTNGKRGNEQILKEVLSLLKFNQHEKIWYNKASFIAEDATKYKSYINDLKQDYTHIYSYNKLMSKECRKKIAKILNNTQYKILAWYNNPKQTKNSGLKNFNLVAVLLIKYLIIAWVTL